MGRGVALSIACDGRYCRASSPETAQCNDRKLSHSSHRLRAFRRPGLQPLRRDRRAVGWKEIAGHKIVGRLLPVDFAHYRAGLEALLREFSPALYIGFGLASGEDMIRIERFGVNLADFDIPDNAGARPAGRALERDGPAARASTLPCPEIRAALLEAGIPARLSNSAGSYLCNATLYSALGLCAGQRPLRLHPPSLCRASGRGPVARGEWTAQRREPRAVFADRNDDRRGRGGGPDVGDGTRAGLAGRLPRAAG